MESRRAPRPIARLTHRQRSLFQSKAAVDEVKGFGAVEPGHQTLERFERYLATR